MGVGNNSRQVRGRSSGRLAAIVALLAGALLIALAMTVLLFGPRLLAWSSQQGVPSALVDETGAVALAERNTREHDRLDSYGWVDQQAGIAHMPVAEAIQRMAAAGLPVGAPEATPASEDPQAAAQQLPDTVSFARDVLPIFVERCGECHSDDNPEEGLEVTKYRTLMLGSIYGAVVKAGDAEGSYLFEQIAGGKMPKKGDRLTSLQIEIVRAWIDAGANDN